MSRRILVAAALCSSLVSSLGARAAALTVYSWPPVKGAAFYIGTQKNDKFRADGPQLVIEGTSDAAPTDLQAYSADGRLLGPVNGPITSSPSLATSPQPSLQPMPSPQPVPEPDPSPDLDPEPAPNPNPSQPTSPRPLRLALAGTFGQERINADGAFSKFAGKATVGGGRLTATLARPQLNADSILSYAAVLDFHRFVVDLSAPLPADPRQNRTVKQRVNLARALVVVQAALWSAAPGADLNAAAGVADEQLAAMKITDAAAGASKLAALPVILPVIGLSQALRPSATTSLNVAARYEPLAVAPSATKASLAELAADAAYNITSAIDLSLGLSWRSASLHHDLACPAANAALPSCRKDSTATTTLTQLQFGAGWTF